jgi:hypothetical protein
MAGIKHKYTVDLEQDITRVWSIKTDIDLFLWRYLDHPEPMTEDEVWNMVSGIGNTLELYCSKLWDDYCKKFELDDYASDEKKANLAEWRKNITKNQESWQNLLMSTTRVVNKKGKKK